MTSGGARNRSGPQADPNSAASDRRGLKFTALPSLGFDGEPPVFPLARRSAAVHKREMQVWAWAWTTPQACAWAQPSEAWRLMTIAMWVRTYVICESRDATAADKSSLHRFADQIGMTPAGLRENGWAISVDEVSAKAAEHDEAPKRERRLRSADAQ